MPLSVAEAEISNALVSNMYLWAMNQDTIQDKVGKVDTLPILPSADKEGCN